MTLSARCLVPALLVLLCACTQPAPEAPAASTEARQPVGRLTTYDPAFHAIVAEDARIERLTGGFTWSEGPAWIRDGQYLLFNDVPKNTLYRWSETDGLTVFLQPSGYAGAPDEALREPGANGLFAEPDGSVLLADSGNRLLARLDPATKVKTTLATHHDGRRFNSPNDVVRRDDGVIFFTDPPYGLAGLDQSPIKELPFNGVYRLDPDGKVTLLDDSLSFPNGIALSPDGRTLYVANSDPARPVWTAYTLDNVGNVQDRRLFADASDLLGDNVYGLPDGIAVAADGSVFATGPGGVIVFAADGRRLGRIETGTAVSNCTFGGNGRTLYLTSNDFIARVPVLVGGIGY